jgi:hypothetical protein
LPFSRACDAAFNRVDQVPDFLVGELAGDHYFVVNLGHDPWRRNDSSLDNDRQRAADVGLGQSAEKLAAPLPVLYVEVDGTGAPMVPAALVGRKGKQPDGTAKTREVKLGCVFTQHTPDAEGQPVRDAASTTYLCGLETAGDFGTRLRREALRRSLLNANGLYLPDPERSTAGVHFVKVLRGLGIHDAVVSRLHAFPNGAMAMRELGQSRDEGLIGCTQITEINYTPGVALVGPLPVEFELATMYSVAVATTALQPVAAGRFARMLTGPEARELRVAGGFEI